MIGLIGMLWHLWPLEEVVYFVHWTTECKLHCVVRACVKLRVILDCGEAALKLRPASSLPSAALMRISEEVFYTNHDFTRTTCASCASRPLPAWAAIVVD